MDSSVQQNAALAEQISAASQVMNDQALQLNKIIGFFKT